MGMFGGWRLIDTAPLDTDVTLLVTDGGGEPYRHPIRASGSRRAGCLLAKERRWLSHPCSGKPYNPPRK
jgi:hypothetical protein